MKNKLLVIVIFLGFRLAFGQETLKNSGVFTFDVKSIEELSTLNCSNCFYDWNVPILQYKLYDVKVPNGVKYKLKYDVAYEEKLVDLSKYGINKDVFGTSEWYPSVPVYLTRVLYDKGEKIQSLSVYPVQIHKSLRKIRINKSISYNLGQISYKELPALRRAYTTNSVLSQGEIFKIKVNKDGIYKITGRDLEQLGVNLSSVDVNKIQIFGNGGGEIPQANDEYYPDDLVELAIKVIDGGDGKFDSDDYILFFGESPIAWKYLKALGKLVYEENAWENYNYYFLRLNVAQGKRLPTQSGPSNYDILETSAPQERVIEEDKVNWLHSGRLWWSDPMQFTLTKTYTLPGDDIDFSKPITVNVRAAARSYYPTTMNFYVNNVLFGKYNFQAKAGGLTTDYADIRSDYFSLKINGSSPLTLKAEYKPVGDAIAWIDYARVDYYRNLNLNTLDYPLYLRFPEVSNKNIKLQFSGNISDYECWDVTVLGEEKLQSWNTGDGFIFYSDTLQRFVVFKHSDALKPLEIVKIENQNLHGLSPADIFVVTTKEFMGEAQRLADFERSRGWKVAVVDAEQIYNEFGSGKREPQAIRNFIKMFYDRATSPSEKPKHLLLFGDASYDNRGFKYPLAPLPSYQSRNVSVHVKSFCSDDFFAFLDPNEGFWREGTNLFVGDQGGPAIHLLDVGVGRLPVSTQEEAKNVVDKIIKYHTDPSIVGEWRNRVVLVGDYKENEPIHISQTEALANIIRQRNPAFKVKKIYLDAYTPYKTSKGTLFPEANKDIARELDRGSLIFNYTGHGSPYQLSYSDIINIASISRINNEGRTAFWTTATCDFGVWDRPDLKSGGEVLMLTPNSGAIGLMTAVRTVFASQNSALNNNFYRHVMMRDSSTMQYRELGEVFRIMKNASYKPSNPEADPHDQFGGSINARSFSLVANPGSKLNYPEFIAKITKINNNPITNDTMIADTLRALSFVTIEGEITDPFGNIKTDFNGDANITVYDKYEIRRTLTFRIPYWIYNNILFKGVVSVKNGKFTSSFYIPLDINYEAGRGRIEVFAHDGLKTASGYNDQFIVCCVDTTNGINNTPPKIELFIDNENWKDGSVTSPNPLLIVKIYDDQGINTTGLGIGREIKAVLNDDEANPIVLNEYYQSLKDDYKSGKIEYKFYDLAPGHYTLKLKAWDISNNSAEATTEFWVVSDDKLEVKNVVNYPNPFTTNTAFLFEHNRLGDEMQVIIKIFSVSGKLVKTITSDFVANRTLIDHITWDGKDDNGDQLARGVYIYQFNLKDLTTDETFSKFEKLVIIK